MQTQSGRDPMEAMDALIGDLLLNLDGGLDSDQQGVFQELLAHSSHLRLGIVMQCVVCRCV